MDKRNDFLQRVTLPTLALVALVAGPHACGDEHVRDTPAAPANPQGNTPSCIADATTVTSPGPFASCAAIPSTDCFANSDCASSERCQNVADPASANYVVCCVEGLRGCTPLGEPCDLDNGELTCASALCMGDPGNAFCSDSCQSNSDCPATLPSCAPIAFSGSSESWCQP